MQIKIYKIAVAALLVSWPVSLLGENQASAGVAESDELQLLVETSTESFSVARELVNSFRQASFETKVSLIVDRDAVGFRKRSKGEHLYLGTTPALQSNDLLRIPIYTESFVFVVNKDCDVDRMSIDQAKSLLIRRKRGISTSWSALGSKALGDVSIHGPLAVSETSRFIMNAVVGDLIGGYNEHEKYRDIVNAVAGNRLAIGFLPLGYVPDDGVRILAIEDEDSPNLAAPTKLTVPERYPLKRVGYIFAEKKESNEGLTREFIQFLDTKTGRDAILACGLVPVEFRGDK